jgi:hypothetical protein
VAVTGVPIAFGDLQRPRPASSPGLFQIRSGKTQGKIGIPAEDFDDVGLGGDS